jgi:hypothetical protein
MTVIDIIETYGLEGFEKEYQNQYGNFCDQIPLSKLRYMEVKSINIHFPTNSVTITIIQHI